MGVSTSVLNGHSAAAFQVSQSALSAAQNSFEVGNNLGGKTFAMEGFMRLETAVQYAFSQIIQQLTALQNDVASLKPNKTFPSAITGQISPGGLLKR